MAMVCTNITEWIETNVSKPVEEWEEDQEKKCKKHHWYDPRSWFCWFITILVKVIRWVVVTVVTAVVTIVCHLISDLLGIIWDLLKFLGNLLKALFTWDKCTLQEALANLGDSIVRAVELTGDVIIRPITDRIQTYRLRQYVGHQIDQPYWQQPEVVTALKNAFNVDAGVFGYRVTCTVYRMYVDSQTKTDRFGDVPNLYALHNAGLINLYQLAGFDRYCAIFDIKKGWYHPRPQTATFPFLAGGGGIGEPTPPELTKDELTEYINSAGQKGPHFRIYAISPGNLDTRIDAAKEKGRQLGLVIDFKREDKEVTDHQFINYNFSPINVNLPTDENQIDCSTKNKGQIDYLICELGRRPKSDFKCCNYAQQPQMIQGSLEGALADLCSPAAVAVFGFTNKTSRGLTSNLIGTTTCAKVSGDIDVNLDADRASGVSFIDDVPDEIRKYVLIHELGHYFGLCHVDGFDRIMVSGAEGQGDWFTGRAIPNVFWHGGPRFIYTEAKRVWDFILANFPLSCFIHVEDRPPVIL